MALLSIKDISYIYTDGTPHKETALDGVSFDIEEGDFLGIIGHTGSGKSTLLQHMNGLLAPASGQVLFEGDDIHAKGYRINELRFKVGMVFQYPEHQLFEETVRKDISFGPKNMGLSESEIAERVTKAAAFCGLREELLERSPFELSGGQKRRAAIAGVIAMEPRVLVLDEPAAGLDPAGRDKILTQIKEFHKNTKTTVVLVSHSMDDIARYCDKVLVLDAGKVFMFGQTREVFLRSEELKKTGLDIPEMTKVLLLLREKGFDADTSAVASEEVCREILRLGGGGANA